MRYQTTVSNIVHMGGQVIPAVAFGDKGTQLDILDGHFLATDTPGQDFFQLPRDWDDVPKPLSSLLSVHSDNCRILPAVHRKPLPPYWV